jgi:hypothetical protein
LVALESATQPATRVGGAGAVELKQLVRDCGSHSSNHGVEGDDYCGGGRGIRGGVKKGPTCCTGKSYWGAMECGADQYGVPPMYGLRKDDQYGAPPMDGLRKASTVGGWRCAMMLVAVLAGALATSANRGGLTKGSIVPDANDTYGGKGAGGACRGANDACGGKGASGPCGTLTGGSGGLDGGDGCD